MSSSNSSNAFSYRPFESLPRVPVKVERRRLKPRSKSSKSKRRSYDRPYFLDSDEIHIDYANAEIVVVRGCDVIGRFNARNAPDCLIHRIFEERRLMNGFHEEFVRAMDSVEVEESVDLIFDGDEFDFFQVRAKEMEMLSETEFEF